MSIVRPVMPVFCRLFCRRSNVGRKTPDVGLQPTDLVRGAFRHIDAGRIRRF